MYLTHFALPTLAWLLALAWLYKLQEATRGLRTIPNLLEVRYDVAPAGMPSVAVIVPARNEAETVGACLESLLRQDYANLRIVAVDDRSTDQTGAIMDVLAAANEARLAVLHVSQLPAGWLGKTHAMASAARVAIHAHSPDYLLFTDGDVLFRADAIRRALAQAEAAGAHHFILMPTTIAHTHGEAMMLAYVQTMSMWAARLWRVADPKAQRDAIGVGAFNLIRTTAYERLGGFEAAPMEVLEDLILGRRVKHAGLRQRVATGSGMVRVHWATGVLGLIHGLTKNVFAVFRYCALSLLAAATGLLILCLGPLAFLALPGARVPALASLAAVIGMYRLSSRSTLISAWYAVSFPVAAVLTVYSMLRSLVVTLWRGGVMWRGTFYPLAELRSQMDRKR